MVLNLFVILEKIGSNDTENMKTLIQMYWSCQILITDIDTEWRDWYIYKILIQIVNVDDIDTDGCICISLINAYILYGAFDACEDVNVAFKLQI